MTHLDSIDYVDQNFRVDVPENVVIARAAVGTHRHCPALGLFVLNQAGVAYDFGTINAFLWINRHIKAN